MEHKFVRRAPRQPFAVDVEIINEESGARIRDRTTDLTLHGCGVRASELFASGTRVMLNLTRGLEKVAASGRVVYASQNLGMGIAFTTIEPEDQRMLERWMSELTSQE